MASKKPPHNRAPKRNQESQVPFSLASAITPEMVTWDLVLWSEILGIAHKLENGIKSEDGERRRRCRDLAALMRDVGVRVLDGSAPIPTTSKKLGAPRKIARDSIWDQVWAASLEHPNASLNHLYDIVAEKNGSTRDSVKSVVRQSLEKAARVAARTQPGSLHRPELDEPSAAEVRAAVSKLRRDWQRLRSERAAATAAWLIEESGHKS